MVILLFEIGKYGYQLEKYTIQKQKSTHDEFLIS